MGTDVIRLVDADHGLISRRITVCRHRGNRLWRADTGNAACFTCAYHGWTYSNDGWLVGVPAFKEGYCGALDMAQWGLMPVAQLDSYEGLILATFDPTAPLFAYLGEMPWYLEACFDRCGGGIEVFTVVHTWVIPCNWRFPAENFGGDAYHVAWSRLPAIQTGFSTGATLKPATGGTMLSPGRGAAAPGRLPVNTQMGLGHDRFDPALQAWASAFRLSENNHRHFYRRWTQLMTADRWADV